jgi:serine protease Do
MIQSRLHRVAVSGVIVASLALSAAGCASSAGVKAEGGSAERPVPATIVPHPALAQVTAQGASIADIAERALPSVVNISSTKVTRAARQNQSPLDDPFFRRFFGPGETPRERREQGLGSGVIVSKDGIVLTNNHVVENADEIRVTTSNKREYGARVIGTDPKSDLAVIKLVGDTAQLKPIEIGDSSRLRLGDVVLAIGNPFGVGQTVTMGIVSAKGRANVGIVDYEDFIQTDAAINPGNSGGALVNMQGQLVGINTAILSRTGGNMGIGFAIPMNMAKPIKESLEKHGKVVRGWLGVSIQDMSGELAKGLGLPAGTDGVLISDVSANGPAMRAGLRRGDVIQKLAGVSVGSTGELRNAVAAAGTTSVKLDILRDGKPLAVEVKLGEMAKDAPDVDQEIPAKAEPGSALDGVRLESLTPGARQKYGIGSNVTSGVVITGVDPASAAARAGLRPGDVVLEIGRQKVDGVERFRELYTGSKGSLLLLVQRNGMSHYLVVRR